MFIQDQIREQVRRDVRLTFKLRNPNTTLEYPLTGVHALMYGVRWVQFYKLPDFIH